MLQGSLDTPPTDIISIYQLTELKSSRMPALGIYLQQAAANGRDFSANCNFTSIRRNEKIIHSIITQCPGTDD